VYDRITYILHYILAQSKGAYCKE